MGARVGAAVTFKLSFLGDILETNITNLRVKAAPNHLSWPAARRRGGWPHLDLTSSDVNRPPLAVLDVDVCAERHHQIIRRARTRPRRVWISSGAPQIALYYTLLHRWVCVRVPRRSVALFLGSEFSPHLHISSPCFARVVFLCRVRRWAPGYPSLRRVAGWAKHRL